MQTLKERDLSSKQETDYASLTNLQIRNKKMCKDVQDYIHDSNKYELYTVISPVSGLQPEIFLILHDERVKDKATGCRDLPIKLYYSSD